MRVADTALFQLVRDAFARYRLRSALNVAGIACGVAVAVTTAAVNDGARRAAAAEVSRLGANTFTIRGHAAGVLSVGDVSAAGRLFPFVDAVVPLIRSEQRIVGPHGSIAAVVIGTTSAYATVRNLHATRGRLLRVDEDDDGPSVCVVDDLVARAVFGYDDPVGASVRVGGAWYRVVGVLDSAGHDRSVVAPVAALAGRALSLDPQQQVDELQVQVFDERVITTAAADVVRLLAQRHSTRKSDYEVSVPRDLLDHRTSTQRLFSIVGAATAALLLLVGGIGVTTAMLTTVSDRTGEIGLRRAVGATKHDIVVQFLGESSTIALVGGAVGLVVGTAATIAFGRVTGWPIALPVVRMGLFVLAAALVGLVSGVYPAKRAAGIAPVRAIMHE